MVGLCDSGNEPPGSLKAICKLNENGSTELIITNRKCKIVIASPTTNLTELSDNRILKSIVGNYRTNSFSDENYDSNLESFLQFVISSNGFSQQEVMLFFELIQVEVASLIIDIYDNGNENDDINSDIHMNAGAGNNSVDDSGDIGDDIVDLIIVTYKSPPSVPYLEQD
ncbi:hypothetical protein ANN_05211 [Periplaneta americana]|uniref:Uncharacterized protein n=1 Tax=Periplaneta americana TaxID=6978 RepID=A0ABQ8TC78_PERAM|nr:hypothetical protein ANN_05211 [Periplaneta americana]